jgi:AraC-like DNA-binding protein
LFVILLCGGEEMFSEIVINKNYEAINPVLFGYESCKKSHAYGPATRLYWLFHFVVSGKGIFQIGDRKYELSGGMMFVIPPFVQTYYQADEEDPWEYIWVGFTGQPPLTLKDTYNIPQALRIFEHMKASCTLQFGKTEFILSKIWELFSVLMEENETYIDPVDRALNLIHAEYMTAITVQQIADRLSLDRTYFSGLFHKRMGVSPKQYLMKHRMEQAKFLLAYGYSITVTAFSVGYQDVYTFSKMFKQHFGKAPSYYRNKLSG